MDEEDYEYDNYDNVISDNYDIDDTFEYLNLHPGDHFENGKLTAIDCLFEFHKMEHRIY